MACPMPPSFLFAKSGVECMYHSPKGFYRRLHCCAGLKRSDEMAESLQELLAAAKTLKPSTEQNEQQRRSFAFGNTNIENPQITRETVDKEAEELKRG